MEFITPLKRRARLRRRLDLLLSGKMRTRDDRMVDTTTQSAAEHRGWIAEIDAYLAEEERWNLASRLRHCTYA